MDGFRYQLNRALDILASTEERRVFAHLLAPHTPFLYDRGSTGSPPDCWPSCATLEVRASVLEMTVADWATGIDGYLAWLNPRILEAVDAIIARYPNADIVLFSDHGGRFDSSDLDEWRRTFLAARTPGRPALLADSPQPGSLLPMLAG